MTRLQKGSCAIFSLMKSQEIDGKVLLKCGASLNTLLSTSVSTLIGGMGLHPELLSVVELKA